MDALAALRLQMEWGADEALDPAPQDRFLPAPAARPLGAPALPRPSAAPAPVARVAAPPAASLDELHQALQAFEGCALRATAMHTVRPDGNPAAGLVVIADAPGSEDDRSGRAFSGAAGQVVDRVLGSIGLDRSAMLLTSLVPWRPPGNRPLAEAEITACLPFLWQLLALTRPRRLVLLGAAAARAVTGSAEPFRRLRGKWLDAAVPGLEAPVPALPLPPPELWLRSAAARRDTWSDLLLLRRTLDAG